MKKVIMLLLEAVFFCILFISCSDESTNPPVTDSSNKYFPLKVGSWWTYSNYELDEDNNKVPGSEFNSKYLIDSKETKEGKESSVFLIQDLQGNKIEDNKYFYTTKTQIFEFSKLLPPMDFSLPIIIPETWYKMADESGAEWTLYSEELQNDTLLFGSYIVILNDVFDIKVENEGFEEVSYGTNMDKTVNARKYKISYSFGGNATLGGPFPIPIQIPFTVESYSYFGENIGLVKEEMLSMSIQSFYNLPGSGKVLLDYNIAE